MRWMIIVLFSTLPVLADPATVVSIEASPGNNGWRFDVTLEHADTGWGDFADGWRVELEDGTVVGERPLAHPHVNEQPFTRSAFGVTIPQEVSQVFVRTRTNVEGWAEERTAYSLPQ